MIRVFKRILIARGSISDRVRSLGREITKNLDEVDEDQEIVLKVQKGIKSMFYNNGRYSVKHEKGIHHFHIVYHCAEDNGLINFLSGPPPLRLIHI